MKLIVVTGSGTDAGKTICTAALTACAIANGLRVAVVKPVQTGVDLGEPGDMQSVTALTGLIDVHELARYDEALAPGTAARRLGVPGPSVGELADAISALADRELLIVEGAGGALVQLNAGGDTLLDLAVELRSRLAPDDSLEMLLTASCSLGTLHSASATAMAIRAQGLQVDHLVIADWPTSSPDLAQRSNLEDLPRYCGVPLSGVLPMGMGSLDQARFARQSQAGLAPTLGGVFNTAESVRLASRP
ncbi:MAG: dethiobiotin synthase [Actinomycetota bacterium]|nr:dethiobiotin synthase [Actinomycetota bacterium]